ncbi:hypothetical protein EPI10_016562 [Gossypium australe]|uniref:Uncharacterized protein n=1 Tax=Gossypium australe TaxID=47621 RepID=A0A5B6VP00_9ROSI|nr:hypothetical protein EPI10_016562 [Gossypium australe]
MDQSLDTINRISQGHLRLNNINTQSHLLKPSWRGKLSSQIELNPQQNVSAMTIKDGMVLETVPSTSRDHDTKRE